MIRVVKGQLVEYTANTPRLALGFEFNPQTISRSREISFPENETPGNPGGYDFQNASETPRISQGVTVNAETFSVDILLDATDRMNAGDPTAAQFGIAPELDTLRSMVEPKVQGPGGQQTLASLGQGEDSGFSRDTFASVFLFIWGGQALPVFLTSVRIEEAAHLPTLIPYRATVSLGMKVIESRNPFFTAEKSRQQGSARRYIPGNIPPTGGMI
ncbi:MAG: hypothetical protein HUN04_16565 [Desulfobacter sp.]|nr:MAG: hypothetical protein HUN04_16565 [Desulfobacter sp.]